MTRTHWHLIAVVALLAAGLAALWREANPAWAGWQARYNAQPGVTPVAIGIQALTPTGTGKPELCVTCHIGIEDISPSHPAQAMGCIICHGGDPLALDADRAHATLRGGKNPADLSVAAQNCGQPNCHGGYADPEQNHVDRVLKSLQATYAGGIASVRYAFGAQSAPTALFGVHAVQDSSASLPANALPALGAFFPVSGTIEAQFQQSCLAGGCHLWAAAKPQTYYARSTGCAACHVLYTDAGLYQGQNPTIPRDQPGHGAQHRLTTAIPYSQCDHCHNRGTYSLKQMAFLPRQDLPPVGQPIPQTMPPEGKQLKEYYQPLTQFTKCEVELNCVDCHTAQEVMGTGHIYGSKKDAQYIQCQTCHGTPTTKPVVATITQADELVMRQARINGNASFLQVGDQVVETTRGEKLWSIKALAPDQFVQVDKVTGKQYALPLVAGSKCTQSGTDQSSQYCHQCHSMPQ
ncbi:MAG: hypothetical protein WCF84_23025 [Anaerolineae bacterium]